MSTTDKKSREKVVETATYRRAKIYITNHGRYIVTVDRLSYPAEGLQDAKDMIDKLRDNQRN